MLKPCVTQSAQMLSLEQNPSYQTSTWAPNFSQITTKYTDEIGKKQERRWGLHPGTDWSPVLRTRRAKNRQRHGDNLGSDNGYWKQPSLCRCFLPPTEHWFTWLSCKPRKRHPTHSTECPWTLLIAGQRYSNRHDHFRFLKSLCSSSVPSPPQENPSLRYSG